jgi:FkbM family methyltransferase
VNLHNLIMNTTQKLGFQIRRYPWMYDCNVAYKRTKLMKNLNVSLVLDVGANIGQYTKELRLYKYEGRVVSFEPLTSAYSELERVSEKDKKWQCLNIALGNINGTTTINISGNSVSSSLLEMKQQHIDVLPNSAYVKTQDITIRRLDSIAPEIVEKSDYVYLKMDVQGYQKQVLLGSLEILSQVVAIEVELPLTRLYDNEPALVDILEYMEHLDFELISVENGFTDPTSGYALQADGIFIKRSKRI